MSTEAIESLVQYCRQSDITIHPSLQAKQVTGAGLGIYATSTIKADKTIIFVPNKHIFTTANIPQSFLTLEARKHLPVHAQLAAYLAFGNPALDPWTATWPSLEDFTSGMPIFWNHWASAITTCLSQPSHPHATKRRRLTIEKDAASMPHLSLSPLLTGWMTKSPPGVLPKMVEKLISHIKLINEARPDLELNKPSNLARFLHMWAIVNTRCFYYIPPSTRDKRQKIPSDPNEAMALCPFMDLFNHTSSRRSLCRANYHNTGFEVVTKQPVPAGSEVLLSYGAHSNDMLWAEYGFIMDSNDSDCVLLDEIILVFLKDEDREVLEECGYLGTYTIHADGSICYRTEMVAWCLVLGRQKWKKVVGEGGDPEENCTSPTGSEKFQGHVVAWLRRAMEVVEQNEKEWGLLSDEQLWTCLGTIKVVLDAVGSEEDIEVWRRRRETVLRRWRQIHDMLELGMQNIKNGQ